MPPSFENQPPHQLETPDIPPSLDAWLNKEMPAQYFNNLNYLQETNQLSSLSTGRMGISAEHSIDGQEYPLPSLSQIKRAILKDKESRDLFTLKLSHGFTRLNITPFAKPLETLANEYGEDLKRHFAANDQKLYSAAPDPYDPHIKLSELKELDLDINQPVWVGDYLKQTNINNQDQLKYHPQSLDSNHGGRTKSEILTDPASTGFEITLIPPNPVIPKKITNQTPRQYLALTKTKDRDSIYFGTRGQTPEGAFNLHRQTLHHTNQVLGDWEGNDKLNYCIGAYLPGPGLVPDLGWFRVRQRADLDRCGPDDRFSYRGFLPAVGVLC